MSETKKYFAGANSAKSFSGYFNYIVSPSEAEHIYCIKGGPGVGKSTFMKKAGRIFEKAGHKVSYFHCPSDPSSLDGVLSENLRIAFIDGTAPHMTDPVYPGVSGEILDFGRFFSKDKLKSKREEIIALTDESAKWFFNAKSKLRTVGTLYDNIRRIYRKGESEKRTFSFLKKLSDEIFSDERDSLPGIRKLLLTAITPDGPVDFSKETLKGKRIISLKSFCGDLSADIMKKIAEESILRGFYTECFYCPLSPYEKIDHIVIPALETAITVSNAYHFCDEADFEADLSECIGKIDKASVSKGMETVDKLISDSIASLKKAKELHIELEKYYIDAMDYDSLDGYQADILEKLKLD